MIFSLIKNTVCLRLKDIFIWRGELLRKILHIAVPSGIENGLFALGKVLVTSIVALFGTAQIAANGVANSIDQIAIVVVNAVNLAMITVVGQCIGAQMQEQAEYYTRKLMKISYVSTGILGAAVCALLPLILQFYNLSAETLHYAAVLIIMHNVFAFALHPTSFNLANSLRAAGDAGYTMFVGVGSMLIFRLGAAFLFGIVLNMGIIGIWIAMGMDWLARSAAFLWRYKGGKYGWTTDLDTMKRSVDWQLAALKTDYIDFGFLHCIDEEADLRHVMNDGILKYIQQLKKEDVVRHIGLFSHTPEVVHQALDAKILDMLMFSINPVYDNGGEGKYAIGGIAERRELYQRCEAEGVAISVMKAFSGGQLLNAETSPFGQALTELQCIQYALDKPGVITVLTGVRDTKDLKRILKYTDAAPEERDYSVLGTFTPQEAKGICVYCNHCQPCPAGLDVGLINKYYDLTRAGDELAKNHYANLEKKAGDCVGCGRCDLRCPFHVRQTERMQIIQTYFGR